MYVFVCGRVDACCSVLRLTKIQDLFFILLVLLFWKRPSSWPTSFNSTDSVCCKGLKRNMWYTPNPCTNLGTKPFVCYPSLFLILISCCRIHLPVTLQGLKVLRYEFLFLSEEMSCLFNGLYVSVDGTSCRHPLPVCVHQVCIVQCRRLSLIWSSSRSQRDNSATSASGGQTTPPLLNTQIISQLRSPD